MTTRSVWKYPLRIMSEQFLRMPVGAEILAVQMQRGEPQIWALVDIAADRELVKFRVVGTGHQIEAHPGEFIGTFEVGDGVLIWHVFRDTSEARDKSLFTAPADQDAAS